MAEYLTTKEVARYLKLNEKKIYALVQEGSMPAARISGKWLFPKHLIDQWVEEHTVYPATNRLHSLLDEMIIIQGSDDWLFSKVIKHFQASREVAVVSSKVGSLAGLAAVGAGKAHLAAFHTDEAEARKLACKSGPCYFVNLFTRQQGIIYDKSRHADIKGLAQLAKPGFRFAVRQPLSGTWQLTRELFEMQGLSMEEIAQIGPFSSHLELALAVKKGRADAGIGIYVVAELCGLDFLPLHTEQLRLAVPMAFSSHTQIRGFLQFTLDELKATSVEKSTTSYKFQNLGLMEALGKERDIIHA